VIHAGVDTCLFAPRAVPKAGRPTVIFAGKLARNKGVFELLEACAALRSEFPDLHLRLLGRGESQVRQELQALAVRLGQPELLELAGFVERTELPEHFSRAHLFAAPSRYEGGPGFVYLEAMACGLPVIACAGSGAAEVVRPGENGLLVPPGDLGALVSALRLLLCDTDQRQRMAEQARQFVLAAADSQACVQKLAAFYADVVAGRMPPACATN
jgi:glycosyltransferase involved in cell wall biosynthesis